ncbi:MAG: DUF2148 domain-containing protein [Porphyromonadaceae bacterium]|nr:DUF2148 domain-containing protein [Porphyromonadaceae bacterium]
MKLNERAVRKDYILEAARQIMAAARTAPKGKGVDLLEIVTLTDEDIDKVAEQMERMAKETGMHFLLRDSENIRQANAMVVIGTHSGPQGLNCAYCGFASCGEKPQEAPCAINAIDVGIAIGSACAKAADLRVDSRVLFSAGWAVEKMGLLPGCRQCLALPLSVSSKNPFFDRKPKEK